MKVYRVSLFIAHFALEISPTVLGSPMEPGGLGSSYNPRYGPEFNTTVRKLCPKFPDPPRGRVNRNPPNDAFLPQFRSQQCNAGPSRSLGTAKYYDGYYFQQRAKMFVEKYRELIEKNTVNHHLFSNLHIKIIGFLFKGELDYCIKDKHPHKLLTRPKLESDYLKEIFLDQLIILAYVAKNKDLVTKTLITIDKLTDEMTSKGISPEDEKFRRVLAVQIINLTALAAREEDHEMLGVLVRMLKNKRNGYFDNAQAAVAAIIAQFTNPKVRSKIHGFGNEFKKRVLKTAETRQTKGNLNFEKCLRFYGMYSARTVIYNIDGKDLRNFNLKEIPPQDYDDSCKKNFFYGVNPPGEIGALRVEDFIVGYTQPLEWSDFLDYFLESDCAIPK
ncbi:hypothetical protein IWQ62_004398 [Dispira parvispora]|uniref:Uncharacterized protein n=1 Tax=Dispira parvispora TaxID=1520584 RepID=A0A9W8E5N2_9FUNG|nr:hypothetical protein IWQ62_004398 [Dispira parvispora]